MTITQQLLHVFKSSVRLDPASVFALLAEAHTVASEIYGIRAAQEWGAGFVFPSSVYATDAAALAAHHNDFPALVAARQAARAPRRLTLARVHATLGVDGTAVPDVSAADFARISELASDGIRIPLPPGFRRCASPPKLRTKYVQVASAVNKLLFDQYSAGTVVLLPLAVARNIPRVHFSAQHWTTKKGKAQGRLICDVANADTAATSPLNGDPGPSRDTLRAELEERWGTIKHPTLPALMRMILTIATLHGWEDIVLWKKDLQGAFNLLWIHPTDAPLLAFLLSAGIVALHIAGMFGWAGMPFVFDVVTRCLRALVRAAIRGAADMYVDDLMGVAHRRDLLHDMAAADRAVRSLLGPDAIAANKDEFGRKLDFIGWEVDLDTRRVTLSRRNFLRMVHTFFCFEVTQPLPLDHVERLASLASRCSTLARQMRPFTSALYLCASMYQRHHQRRLLSSAARADVCIWRAFLIASHFDPVRVARPIESFQPRSASVVIEYDSSLTAFAVGVSILSPDASAQLRAFAVATSPFAPTCEAKFQNTYEFLAVLLGLLLMHRLNLRSCAYSLRGDSVSSLTWAATDRTASSLARRANIGFTLLASEIDAVVADTVHVPGTLNTVYDGLSRGVSAADAGLDPALQVHLHADHPYLQYLALCDPTAPLSTLADHLALAANFTNILSSLSPQHS